MALPAILILTKLIGLQSKARTNSQFAGFFFEVLNLEWLFKRFDDLKGLEAIVSLITA
ncbi:MAG: hypothetical protein ACFFGZ_09615 [Candidatus Thorarchaeota archaeon]